MVRIRELSGAPDDWLKIVCVVPGANRVRSYWRRGVKVVRKNAEYRNRQMWDSKSKGPK